MPYTLTQQFLKIGIYGSDNPLAVGTPTRLPLKGSSCYCRKLDSLTHTVELVKPCRLLKSSGVFQQKTYLLEEILDLQVTYSVEEVEVLRRGLFDLHPSTFVFHLPDYLTRNQTYSINQILEELKLGRTDFRVELTSHKEAALSRNWVLTLNNGRPVRPQRNYFTLADLGLLSLEEIERIEEDHRRKRVADAIPYKTQSFGRLIRAFTRGEYERCGGRVKGDAESYLTLNKEGRLVQEQELTVEGITLAREIRYDGFGQEAGAGTGGQGVVLVNIPHRKDLEPELRSPYRRAVNLILRALVEGKIEERPRLKWEWNPAVDGVAGVGEEEKEWELVEFEEEELGEQLEEGLQEQDGDIIGEDYFILKKLDKTLDGIGKQVIIRVR